MRESEESAMRSRASPRLVRTLPSPSRSASRNAPSSTRLETCGSTSEHACRFLRMMLGEKICDTIQRDPHSTHHELSMPYRIKAFERDEALGPQIHCFEGATDVFQEVGFTHSIEHDVHERIEVDADRKQPLICTHLARIKPLCVSRCIVPISTVTAAQCSAYQVQHPETIAPTPTEQASE